MLRQVAREMAQGGHQLLELAHGQIVGLQARLLQRFGAQQLVAQHKGLWDLLEARSIARSAACGSLTFTTMSCAHASAAVLIGTGAFPLIPLEIAGQLASSAATGGEGTAMALGVTTGVVAVIVLIAFNALTKRSAAWLDR